MELLCDFVLIFLGFGLVLGSLGIILLTDIVHSAFLLGFVFACTALLYLLLDSDFLATAQILIYVGAVNVLIVFAVMLIKRRRTGNSFLFWTVGDGITSTMCTGIFLLLNYGISNISWSEIHSIARADKEVEIVAMDNIRLIGSKLLTEFLIPFELVSIILLVALVGAITLARVGKTIDSEWEILRSKKNS